jgi:uncharacterized protein YdbL (DUF1318 family)
MKRLVVALLITCTLIAAGCLLRTEHKFDVTIDLNIRHVEEEVQGVFDYVEGKTDEIPEIETVEGEPGAGAMMRRALEMIRPVRTCYAAEKDTSPEVERLAKSMRERHHAIQQWKEAGCLGENNRGYLELRECDAVKEAEKKNTVQKLMAEENKDRKALYAELARLKKLSVSKIETIAAKDKLNRADSGEIVQLPPAGEPLEDFKRTTPGRRLGSKAAPNAWVKMP